MTIVQFITLTITLALAAFGLTNAAKLGWSECRVMIWRERAKRREAELAEMTKAAAYWQQTAGELGPDALRYRLHLKDCAKGGKTAAQRSRAPILAKMAEIQGGSQ